MLSSCPSLNQEFQLPMAQTTINEDVKVFDATILKDWDDIRTACINRTNISWPACAVLILSGVVLSMLVVYGLQMQIMSWTALALLTCVSLMLLWLGQRHEWLYRITPTTISPHDLQTLKMLPTMTQQAQFACLAQSRDGLFQVSRLSLLQRLTQQFYCTHDAMDHNGHDNRYQAMQRLFVWIFRHIAKHKNPAHIKHILDAKDGTSQSWRTKLHARHQKIFAQEKFENLLKHAGCASNLSTVFLLRLMLMCHPADAKAVQTWAQGTTTSTSDSKYDAGQRFKRTLKKYHNDQKNTHTEVTPSIHAFLCWVYRERQTNNPAILPKIQYQYTWVTGSTNMPRSSTHKLLDLLWHTCFTMKNHHFPRSQNPKKKQWHKSMTAAVALMAADTHNAPWIKAALEAYHKKRKRTKKKAAVKHVPTSLLPPTMTTQSNQNVLGALQHAFPDTPCVI